MSFAENEFQRKKDEVVLYNKVGVQLMNTFAEVKVDFKFSISKLKL